MVGAGFVGFALLKIPRGREKVGWLWGAGKPGSARPCQESGKAAQKGQNCGLWQMAVGFGTRPRVGRFRVTGRLEFLRQVGNKNSLGGKNSQM